MPPGLHLQTNGTDLLRTSTGPYHLVKSCAPVCPDCSGCPPRTIAISGATGNYQLNNYGVWLYPTPYIQTVDALNGSFVTDLVAPCTWNYSVDVPTTTPPCTSDGSPCNENLDVGLVCNDGTWTLYGSLSSYQSTLFTGAIIGTETADHSAFTPGFAFPPGSYPCGPIGTWTVPLYVIVETSPSTYSNYSVNLTVTIS